MRWSLRTRVRFQRDIRGVQVLLAGREKGTGEMSEQRNSIHQYQVNHCFPGSGILVRFHLLLIVFDDMDCFMGGFFFSG